MSSVQRTDENNCPETADTTKYDRHRNYLLRIPLNRTREVGDRSSQPRHAAA